jgi:putative transposase
MENFFGILKSELTHHRIYRTRLEAIWDITEYIEVFYNRQHPFVRLSDSFILHNCRHPTRRTN